MQLLITEIIRIQDDHVHKSIILIEELMELLHALLMMDFSRLDHSSQNFRLEDTLVSSISIETSMFYTTDFSFAIVVFLLFPFVAISEMNVALTQLPTEILTRLVSLLSVLLAQHIQPNDLINVPDSTKLSVHETAKLLRCNQSQIEDLVQILSGKPSLKFGICAIPVVSSLKHQFIDKLAFLPVLTSSISDSLSTLHCELEDLWLSHFDHRNSDEAQTPLSALCSSTLR